MEPQSEEVESRVRRSVLEALGVGVKSLTQIPHGLGRRSFFRVETQSGEPVSLVARVDADEDPTIRPAGTAPEPPLEPLRTFLASHGMPVPLRFGGAEGVDLLEDLGTRSLEDVVREVGGDERRALYEEACDLVVRIQQAGVHGATLPAFERRLDRELLRFKGQLFARWSLPTALGRTAHAAERAVVDEAFACIAEHVERAPARLAHRDLQSSNLCVRPRPRGGRRLAMIDFQGAFVAPPEYDLVCLLRDSYVELPDAEVEHHLARARPLLPDRPGREEYARRFDLLTLSRKAKDHARLLSAAASGSNDDALRHVPATVRALRRAAERQAPLDPRLARLAELVTRLPESP